MTPAYLVTAFYPSGIVRRKLYLTSANTKSKVEALQENGAEVWVTLMQCSESTKAVHPEMVKWATRNGIQVTSGANYA